VQRYLVTRIALVLAASLLAVSHGMPFEDGIEHGRASAPAFVPMEAIVKFRKDARDVIAAELTGVSAIEVLRERTALVHFDAAGSNDETARAAATWALIHELRGRPDVEYAHPNWLYEFSRVPNDLLYSNQWHYPAIQLPQAWDLTTGSPAIRIAILDTGRTAHPELDTKWVPGLEYDAIAQDYSAVTDSIDTYRHGIHVAGIVGGESNNGEGSAGVCWACQLLNIKVSRYDSLNGVLRPDEAAVIRGIYWAVDNGAQVLNMSFEFNGQPCSHPDRSGIREAIAHAIRSNVTVVAAAGNQGIDAANTVPASCPDVIAVAATDRNNALAAYSNRSSVTLAAPGGGPPFYGEGDGCPTDSASQFTSSKEGAFSTWTTSNEGHCYRYLSGTSMAAPHVAGVVGLMLSRNPSMSPARVRQLLQTTAQPLPGCAGQCGAGLLNAFGAVQQAAPLPINDAAPAAYFTAQCAGLECTFDGRSSTDDRGIVSYQWTFPGQQTRTGATTSFFLPGYFMSGTSHIGQPVRLRVTDTAGQSAELLQYITPPQGRFLPRMGAYHNPRRPGHRIELFATSTGEWVLAWYTYEPHVQTSLTGAPVWYNSGVGPRGGVRWSQPLYRYTWNNSSATQTQVGTVSLEFSNATTAWFSWVLNGVPGGEQFVYLGGGQGRSGAWYVPAESGWGINVQESTSLTATVAFYLQGQPRWMQGTVAPGSNVTIPLTYQRGVGLCPSCGGSSAPTVDDNLHGSMNLRISGDASTMGYASTNIVHGVTQTPLWVKPLQPIYILTQP
jgi:serine protease